MRNKSKANGPGHWLCWSCFDHVSNTPAFDAGRQWITKPNPGPYRSKGGPCARCKVIVKYGEKAAKVTLETDIT